MTDFTGGVIWDDARVLSVTDGDTIRATRRRIAVDDIDIDGMLFRVTTTTEDRDHPTGPPGKALRLITVDTPERGTHSGWEDARADLRQFVMTHAPMGFIAICYESAGWDRVLVDLIARDSGTSASEWMMRVKGWPAYKPA